MVEHRRPIRPASQRSDFHRLPVEGAGPRRPVVTRRAALFVLAVALATGVVLALLP